MALRISTLMHDNSTMVHFGAMEFERLPQSGPARVRRNDVAPLAVLQASAGNRAVTALLSSPAVRASAPRSVPWTAAGNRAATTLFVQRQAVRPKAQTHMSGTAGDFQTFIDKGGPYTFSMYALNDDVVGHA